MCEHFNKYYPNADKSKFEAQVVFDEKRNASAEIYFKAGPGHMINIFGSEKEYWSASMKDALGLADGFPMQLTPVKGKSSLPIPAVGAPSLKKIFNNDIKIYVTSDQYFTTKFREIFQKIKLTHHSAKESKKWPGSPNISYWPQQINFAVWMATTGCGISRDIFNKDHSNLGLLTYVYNFYLFHVYFTVRRILFQMGGIQSMSALPGNPTFDQKNNKYDMASYKRICAEFGVSPSSDFRFTKLANHGLGSVFIYVSTSYPGGHNKFSDEGGLGSKGNLIYFIEPDNSAYTQANWFCPNASEGLTLAGLSRITNQ